MYEVNSNDLNHDKYIAWKHEVKVEQSLVHVGTTTKEGEVLISM